MLFVDLKDVTEIDPCALLYLFAQVERIGHLRGWDVRGNWPKATNALMALYDARFQDVVRTSRRGPKVDATSPRLKISFGPVSAPLDPKDWLPLHDFLRLHGSLTDAEADDLYNAFGECVENVRQHAYRRGSLRESDKWFALALRPSETKPARAVIVDLGRGIAKTIRRTPQDRILSWMGNAFAETMKAVLILGGHRGNELAQALAHLTHSDWLCLYFATLGLRTRTSQKQRGTGLSGLRQSVLDMGRGALHVLSGQACVTWQSNQPPVSNRLTQLQGTAVCLEFGGNYANAGDAGGSDG